MPEGAVVVTIVPTPTGSGVISSTLAILLSHVGAVRGSDTKAQVGASARFTTTVEWIFMSNVILKSTVKPNTTESISLSVCSQHDH